MNVREVQVENSSRKFHATIHGRELVTVDAPETSEELPVDQSAIDAHLKARQEEKMREMQQNG